MIYAWEAARWLQSTVLNKEVFTWHRSDFRPGASSLRFPLMALYLFTWYHHKMPCRREPPWREFTPVLVPRRDFTPVRNLAAVSCKRETTTRFGVKSVCRLERVAHAWCLRFWSTRVFYQHEVYLQITRYEMNQSSCKRDSKSKSHPGMKLAPVRVFSCKHPLSDGV